MFSWVYFIVCFSCTAPKGRCDGRINGLDWMKVDTKGLMPYCV